MTKEMQLLNFIKEGNNKSRRWKECEEFYATISPELCHYKEGTNLLWTGTSTFELTAEEAWKANVNHCRRAADYALYRLEKKGLICNPSRGIHQAL